MTPLSVSTIIPTYNRAHLIERAISSVIAASRPQDEIIVVDDGSTDNTAEVVARFGKSVKYIRMDNARAGAARNRGLQQANGDLVAFLDSDDEWFPGKLDLQRKFMAARSDILFAFTDFNAIDKEGNEHGNYLQNWHNDPRQWSEILGPAESLSITSDLPEQLYNSSFYVGSLYEAELSANYVSIQTCIVRRVEAGDALMFAEDLPLYEDWFCIASLARKGKAAYIDCATACQYADASDRLTDAASLARAESRIAIIERVWGKDPKFLEKHGDLYNTVLDEQRLMRAKDLVLLGRNQEAQEELRKMSKAPMMMKLLASFPDWAIQRILAMRPGSTKEGRKQ